MLEIDKTDLEQKLKRIQARKQAIESALDKAAADTAPGLGV